MEAMSSLKRAAASFGESDPLRQCLMGAAETLKADFNRELDAVRAANSGK
jgi:hypothetical protein